MIGKSSYTRIFGIPKGGKKSISLATTNEPIAGFLSGEIVKKYKKKGYHSFSYKYGEAFEIR